MQFWPLQNSAKIKYSCSEELLSFFYTVILYIIYFCLSNQLIWNKFENNQGKIVIVPRFVRQFVFFDLLKVITLLSKLFEKFSNRMATWERKTVPVDICHRMEIVDRQSLSNSNSFLQMHLLDNLHLKKNSNLRTGFQGHHRTVQRRQAQKLTQIVFWICDQLYFWKYFLQVNWNWFSFNIILLPML